jgi:zinc/manganese transport system permease protein
VAFLTHEFVQHALVAGTAVGVVAGVLGYFLVARGQLFSVDVLSHVGFAGALIALCFGIDARVGLFACTIAVGLGLAAFEHRGHADDVVIGSTFAWVLGIGVLALSVYVRGHSAGDSSAGVRVLFGSIFGLDRAATVTVVLVAAAVLAGTFVIGRPLLFASLDSTIAAARGVPVRGLTFAFLGLVGVATAQATQAVGALLVLGLLAAPAGAAAHLTVRPYRAMAVASAIAVGAVWSGVAISYAAPDVPPSFAIIAVAATVYGVSFLARR